ncbi:MAG: hypothetical protein QOF44_425, partial [Streptomyces sp.]|nr:hypothetical protein [Streptomyces sp.]
SSWSGWWREGRSGCSCWCWADVSGVDHLSAGSFEVRQDEQGAQQAGRAGSVRPSCTVVLVSSSPRKVREVLCGPWGQAAVTHFSRVAQRGRISDPARPIISWRVGSRMPATSKRTARGTIKPLGGGLHKYQHAARPGQTINCHPHSRPGTGWARALGSRDRRPGCARPVRALPVVPFAARVSSGRS